MVKPQLLGEEPVSLSEAKSELARIKERDGELNFRGEKCAEYLAECGLLSKKAAEELSKKVQDLGINRLKDEHIVKILDLLPKTADEVKVIFQGSTINISKKDMEQIASLAGEAAE